MEFKEIQELIKILDGSGLTSIEIEKEGFRISLKKETERILQHLPTKPPASHVIEQHFVEQPTKKDQQTIDSPIVGTFYAASSPGDDPYVKVGSKVQKGDVLCIIEAMKLMNEIEAEEDFEILEVLVKDGQMVEYGQALFAVKNG